MSERHVLTVGELKKYLNSINLDDNNPVIIIENDAESVRDDKGNRHDCFEGLRLCNVGGIVYNTYEHEKALVLGFSYENKFKNIIEHGLPTDGNVLCNTLIDHRFEMGVRECSKIKFNKRRNKRNFK